MDSPKGGFCILLNASSGLLRMSWVGLPSLRRPSSDTGDGERRQDERWYGVGDLRETTDL